jgi:hypothetical protein
MMTATTALRVTLDPTDAASSALHRSVLASVPRRFLIAERGPADVAVVSGRHRAWPDQVSRAVDDGARGVLVVRPGLVDPELVRGLVRTVAGRAVVAVDTPFATDPTWTAAQTEVAADAATASIVDSVASIADGEDGDIVDALVGQLAVVRPLLGPLDGLRRLHRGDRGYLLGAHTRGPTVMLSGVTSAAGRAALALDVVASERRWQARFDDTALASPTEVTRYDETGAHIRPLRYESGRRVTWLRLHEALSGNGEVGYSLDRLADDLELAHQALR